MNLAKDKKFSILSQRAVELVIDLNGMLNLINSIIETIGLVRSRLNLQCATKKGIFDGKIF